MSVRITLRNAIRAEAETGYGRINAGLLGLVDSQDDPDAEVQLFASPPYSFRVVPGKFNVGITACDRALNQYRAMNFAWLSNRCQLILSLDEINTKIFRHGGITVPIRQVRIGHNHDEWFAPIREGPNKKVFILDRGRSYRDHRNPLIAGDYFELDYYRCSGQGKLPREELRARYASADIFVNFAHELAWSYPTIEAMSAGCLVMTNCPFVFLNKANSLLFNTVASFRAQLDRCRENSMLEIKQASQKTASEWTWSRALAEIRQVIEEEYEKWLRKTS